MRGHRHVQRVWSLAQGHVLGSQTANHDTQLSDFHHLELYFSRRCDPLPCTWLPVGYACALQPWLSANVKDRTAAGQLYAVV